MKISFETADIRENIDGFLDFMDGEANPMFVDAIAHFYPALDIPALCAGDAAARRTRLEEALRPAYEETLAEARHKCAEFQAAWDICAKPCLAAFGDLFGGDALRAVGSVRGLVSLNPVCPRYLDRHMFTLFYRFPQRYAMETALHETTHFLWFSLWNAVFHDDPELYESPHLPWFLSELAVDPILSDGRFKPYVGQCPAYDCFYGIQTPEGDFMEILRALYAGRASMRAFMRDGYALYARNESALREAYGQ